jgi:ankyrin repeat domain-containing protein 50
MCSRFRWVVCQLDALRKCLTTGHVKKALQQLPKTLDDTYNRILDQINDEYCQFACDIFTFLAFSKRPLKLEEVVEGIAFNPETKCFDDDKKLFDPLDVLQVCSSLITLSDPRTLHNAKGSDEQEDHLEVSKQVRFAHFSVKEFLTSERASKSRFHISVQTSHELIAERSILYMLSNLKAVDLPSPNSFPFLRYSARYWYEHVYAMSNYEGLNDSIYAIIRLCRIALFCQLAEHMRSR